MYLPQHCDIMSKSVLCLMQLLIFYYLLNRSLCVPVLANVNTALFEPCCSDDL